MKHLALVLVAALSIPAAAAAEARYVGRAVVETDDFLTHSDGGSGAAPNSYGVAIATSAARASISNANGGTVTALAQTSRELAGAQATLVYTLDLIGPAAEFVPIRVQARGQVEFSGQGNALAAFAYSYYDHLDPEMDFLRRMISTPAGPFGFSLDEIVFVVPNTRGEILLTASAGAGFSHIGPDDEDNRYAGRGYALVDPVFTIDPAYADRYRLVGVPGEVVAAVPEPGVWALMVLGMGGAGAVLRRRRAVAVSA